LQGSRLFAYQRHQISFAERA